MICWTPLMGWTVLQTRRIVDKTEASYHPRRGGCKILASESCAASTIPTASQNKSDVAAVLTIAARPSKTGSGNSVYMPCARVFRMSGDAKAIPGAEQMCCSARRWACKKVGVISANLALYMAVLKS